MIELYSLSVTVPELRGEMCTARLFSQGSTSLHPNFIWTGSSSINHSWHQKTRETLGYSTVKTASFCSASRHFDTTLECDGQTDLSYIKHTALAKLCCGSVARCKNWKKRYKRLQIINIGGGATTPAIYATGIYGCESGTPRICFGVALFEQVCNDKGLLLCSNCNVTQAPQ